MEKYDGKGVFAANDDTISLEDAVCGYKGLVIIERCFRSLKRTQIKMMPMYHGASRRTEAHVKIYVLALLLERLAEFACGMPWHPDSRCVGGVSDYRIFQFEFPYAHVQGIARLNRQHS